MSLHCPNYNIELYFDDTFGHQDVISIPAELPSINQTPEDCKEFEVTVSLIRDFLHQNSGKSVTKTITNNLGMSISDSAFLAGPKIPWLWISLGRLTEQPNFENVK